MQIIVDGLATTYHTAGEGKPVLLLHGWGDDHRTFNSLVSELRREYKVISVDLPGFGESQLPPRAWGLEDYGRFINHFLDKLHASDLYTIAGHSNGGAIAIYAVGNDLVECQKLILLASSGIRPKNTAKRTLFKVMARIGKISTAFLPSKVRHRLRNRLYAAAGSDYLVSPGMSETFKRIVTEDVRESAQHVSVPTLLMYGTQDEETPVTMGKLLARNITNSQLEVIENAGHHLHHDAADQTTKKVLTFLRS